MQPLCTTEYTLVEELAFELPLKTYYAVNKKKFHKVREILIYRAMEK